MNKKPTESLVLTEQRRAEFVSILFFDVLLQCQFRLPVPLTLENEKKNKALECKPTPPPETPVVDNFRYKTSHSSASRHTYCKKEVRVK